MIKDLIVGIVCLVAMAAVVLIVAAPWLMIVGFIVANLVAGH